MEKQTLIATFTAFMAEQIAEDKFSGCVLIAQHGTPFFAQAYGMAEKNFQVPNDLQCKFNIGSITKAFTAVAIAQLAEQQKLSFDDYLSFYVPEFPTDMAERITIHQLLTHTSGLGDMTDEYKQAANKPFEQLADILPLNFTTKLHFEPGERFLYSNLGYTLLGSIIEKVSGQDYYTYLREHIYKPASMIATDAYGLDMVVPGRAYGYSYGNFGFASNWESRRQNLYYVPYKGMPAGALYSTVHDLLNFSNALRNHTLLTPEYTEIITTGKVEIWPGERYAYGLADRQFKDERIVNHNGGVMGGNAALHIYINNGYTTVVLANYDPPSADKVADKLFELLLAS